MLVAIGSAKGAPGVTTTARVLAGVWPADVVLVDGDPAGGDLSLLCRTPAGEALDPDRGLLSLAADARRGLVSAGLGEHLQRVDGGLDVLCGVTTPDQMTGIAPVWPTIAAALAGLSETDVLVDCGRIAPGSPVQPVVTAADVLILVARPHLESFAHLRERLRWLAHVQDTAGRVPAIGLVLVADSRDRRSARELGQLVAHERLPGAVLGQLADDPRAADVLGGRVERSIARSLLVRSARQLIDPVRALAATRGAVRAGV